MIDIIIFSDSIGTGQYTSLAHSWAALLSGYLSQLSESLEEDIIVTNSSGNGRTTRQALEVMQYEVLSKNPDILIIQYGLNDCNVWADAHEMPRVSEEAFKANLIEIINRAEAANISEIFLIANHQTAKKSDTDYNTLNFVYNRRVRAASKATTAYLLDIEKEIWLNKTRPKTLLLEDGIHLNNKGHMLYFDIILPIVQKAVLRIRDERSEN